MQCDEASELLLLHAGGDLPEDQVAVLDVHLNDCPSCSAELAVARRMNARMVGLVRARGPEFDAAEFARGIAEEIEGGIEPTTAGGLADRVPSDEAARAQLHSRSNRRRWRRQWWLVAASVAALLTLAILRSQEHGPGVPQPIPTSPGEVEFAWSEEATGLLGCFEQPVPLDQWELPGQPSVVAILSRPDPLSRPEVFVLAYCTEGRILSRAPSYPWFGQRLRRLQAQIGPLDELYVAACPLPDSDRHERRVIAARLIRKFRPALNQAGGV